MQLQRARNNILHIENLVLFLKSKTQVSVLWVLDWGNKTEMEIRLHFLFQNDKALRLCACVLKDAQMHVMDNQWA